MVFLKKTCQALIHLKQEDCHTLEGQPELRRASLSYRGHVELCLKTQKQRHTGTKVKSILVISGEAESRGPGVQGLPCLHDVSKAQGPGALIPEPPPSCPWLAGKLQGFSLWRRC